MKTLMTVLGLQRKTFAETMLTLEADNLKSVRPAPEAIYFTLTPEQSWAATPPLTFLGGFAPRN